MNRHRTSLKDIATVMGVSIATVSRALRDSHEVSAEMKERIKAAAKEMNYRPNPFARTLRDEDSHVIGVLVPNLVTHYFAGVLDGIEEEATKSGYSVISTNSHESHIQEEKHIDNLVNLHVSGIIACLAQDTIDYSHYEQIKQMGIPLVFFTRTCLPDMFSSVIAGDDIAAQQATQHLIDSGCRRVAFVGGPNHLDLVRRRKHGYIEALKANGIAIDSDIISCDIIDYGITTERIRQLLRRKNPPDAILTFNNTAALAALEAVKSFGLSIPDDVALIGFTDEEWPEHVTPRFSTIEDRAFEQGAQACRLLISNIQGDVSVRKETVPMKLCVRESSVKKRP